VAYGSTPTSIPFSEKLTTASTRSGVHNSALAGEEVCGEGECDGRKEEAEEEAVVATSSSDSGRRGECLSAASWEREKEVGVP